MASFKVGDRVVVRSLAAARELLGAVGTVMAVKTWGGGLATDGTVVRGGVRYEVDLPSGCDIYPNCWFYSDQIEPYRDDGHEKAEWTDELRRLCKPETVKA